MFSMQIIFIYLLSAVLIELTATTTDSIHDEIKARVYRNIINLDNVFKNNFPEQYKDRNIPQSLDLGNNYLYIPLPLHQMHPTVNYQQAHKYAPHHSRYWYYHHSPAPPPPPPTTTAAPPPPAPCCSNPCPLTDYGCLQAASAIANAQAISQGGQAEASALAISHGNAQAMAQAQAYSRIYNSDASIPRKTVLTPRNNFDFVFPEN